MPKAKRQADARALTERSLRAAVVPYVRRPRDAGPPTALLSLPEDCRLVSSETFRALAWGGTGHRDALRLSAPWLTGQVAEAAISAREVGELPLQQAAAHQDEWLGVPVAVPRISPLPGHAYVMTETGEPISEGGELYHRTWIEEGVPPKQVPVAHIETMRADRKAAKEAGRDAHKLYGETASLGVKLRTIKTKGDGDCFFSSVCKAFARHPTHRDPDMWATMRQWASANSLDPLPASDAAGQPGSAAAGAPAEANGSAGERAGRRSARCNVEAGVEGGATATTGGAEVIDVDGEPPADPDALPPPSEPPTVAELRRCCAAHFSEETWLTCQVVGGSAFAYASEPSLEEARRNIARPASATDSGIAHWADEISLACVQRYLNTRLLVFNPAAQPESRAVTCGGELPGEVCQDDRAGHREPPAPRPKYVLLRHTHRATKQQHYELYALPSGQTVFEAEQLPPEVRRVFARVCPGAARWRHLAGEAERHASDAAAPGRT